MSTNPLTHKPAADVKTATSANAKQVSQPTTTAEKSTTKVDVDRVFRADGTEDTNATKERKLKKIAARRVPVAIKAMRMVGRLGAYKPNETQAKKIVSVLRSEFDEMERRLSVVVVKTEEEGFVL